MHQRKGNLNGKYWGISNTYGLPSSNGLSLLWGYMVSCIMCGAKFALMLKIRKRCWCRSWVCYINTMEEGSVSVLNMDRRLVGTILVLTVNMQKMNIFMVLLGQILWSTNYWMQKGFKIYIYIWNKGGLWPIMNACKGFLNFLRWRRF